ncbi:hypothetical protein [Herbaspirillum sp. SJZ107]|uniref:hypothetical protein n=1 Tax=Herbaspirillum sp. SJZ107 TaxID=2572881 RepID=UPI001152AB32|nr:hypothetical protein [Herbaspirillum sp. SJZ107]TQK05093.1 hypothetical protein FBX97_4058 [Herbaspirillum sp. SJZ107]
MKSRFSAVVLALGMGLVCHAASAQDNTSNVTVTQQGNGNTAYAEQYAITTVTGVQATITQIGDNNHVGGLGGTSSGLIQSNAPIGPVIAEVLQTGRGNNAGLIQDNNGNAALAASARITQTGIGNDATFRQFTTSYAEAIIEQSGDGNIARIEQTFSGDSSLRSVQNGTGNQVTISQSGATYGGPNVTQDGDGNTASVVTVGAIGGGPSIVQTGSLNSATVVQNINGFDSGTAIRQQGMANQADTNLTGEGQRTDITQTGNGNLASVAQTGVPASLLGNFTVIAQLGNSNTAIVRQVGAGYNANVSQTGSGNYTNIYQH